MSDTAAIEWTSRAGVEYKAIHSEDCTLCDYAFGDELCRNSPPCADKNRADGVSIAWVAKRHPLDVTIPEEDFPAPSHDDDEDEDSNGKSLLDYAYMYGHVLNRLTVVERETKLLLKAIDRQEVGQIQTQTEWLKKYLGIE